jgi:hypothetical protein
MPLQSHGTRVLHRYRYRYDSYAKSKRVKAAIIAIKKIKPWFLN